MFRGPFRTNGAASHVARCLGQMARGEKCFWSIILKDGPDELIGRIDLWADDGVSRDQRGFWLDPAFEGQGLMTEAAERGHRIRLRRTRLASSLAEQRRSQRRLWPHQGEARRTADRPRTLPLCLGRGHANGLAAHARGLAGAAQRLKHVIAGGAPLQWRVFLMFISDRERPRFAHERAGGSLCGRPPTAIDVPG